MKTDRTLNDEEMAAIDGFREVFPTKRIKRLGYGSWQEALQTAWMNDWPEQRGTLRVLRNDALRFRGTSDILAQYAKQKKGAR